MDEPSTDDVEPMHKLDYIQDKLDSRTNIKDFLKNSDSIKKYGMHPAKLAPINEERIMNTLVAPNRRKSLDPRAMNKTIANSSGQNLIPARLNKMKFSSRQTSLADVNNLAKQYYVNNLKDLNTVDHQNHSSIEELNKSFGNSP